ncbi:Wzz/FepE/Etk N-terminal domain-containing protein [Paraburkholderia sp. BCC1876]|uniref:Wzz/FepE/Etk N-terminal domain-containing protein n=1 Tax=Paraburkholderia sp. BCC1876 TaxID=2676303 RepID=UPI001592A261|nr:Wzz/FepE/Etk N-terminal domain-containing protein [Paraburkholderia sp. BCC1876]
MHQTPAVARRASSDLVRQVSRSFKLIIVLGILGALAGAVLSHFMQPKWIARMTIQIGQISSPQGGGVVSRPIENQLTAADRYNLPALRLHVLGDLGLPVPDSGSRQSKVIFDTLVATPARSPDLIMLQVSAYSRNDATAALLASFKTFSAPHQKMFDPAIDDLKSQLATSTAKLAQAEQEYRQTYQSLQSTTAQGNASASDPRNVLVTNMATTLNQQVLDLRQQTIALQQAVSPLLTYPTRIVEAPYTPLRSSTPSMLLLIAIGIVLGLLVGVAWAVSPKLR